MAVKLAAGSEGALRWAISAFVFDATGKAHAAGDLDLNLDVGADAATTLALKWDAPSLSYKATFSGQGDLSLQPIRVALVAAGKPGLLSRGADGPEVDPEDPGLGSGPGEKRIANRAQGVGDRGGDAGGQRRGWPGRVVADRRVAGGGA